MTVTDFKLTQKHRTVKFTGPTVYEFNFKVTENSCTQMNKTTVFVRHQNKVYNHCLSLLTFEHADCPTYEDIFLIFIKTKGIRNDLQFLVDSVHLRK